MSKSFIGDDWQGLVEVLNMQGMGTRTPHPHRLFLATRNF